MLKALCYIAFVTYIWMGGAIIRQCNLYWPDKMFLYISVIAASYFMWIQF